MYPYPSPPAPNIAPPVFASDYPPPTATANTTATTNRDNAFAHDTATSLPAIDSLFRPTISKRRTSNPTNAAPAACTNCRNVKMKCTREPNEHVCNRCKKKGLDCHYETHRRGRKPGTKLRPKAERDRERQLKHEKEMRKGSGKLKRAHSGNVKPVDTSTYRAVSADYPLDSGDSDQSTLHIPHSASTISGDYPVKQYSDFQHNDHSRYEDPASINPVDPRSQRQISLDINPNDYHPSPPSTPHSNLNASKSENATASNRRSQPSRRFGPTAALAPFRLLSRSTTAGNFTLANILNAEEEEGHSSSDGGESKGINDLDGVDEQSDPVCLGILNLTTAQSLFDNFFQYMNSFICQFDPRLHTFRYVRSRSAFLFTALISDAAKFFIPELYPKLYSHVDKLLGEIMVRGRKSTEIVHGIALMTYWKEPRDSRAWLLIGYAIRACFEMGWHQLRPTNLEPNMEKLQPEKEMELRERRNKERTWLMLFVSDRSVSLQVGKPWMIPMDTLIRSSESWHSHAYALPGTDHIMSAFVQLRILGSELLDLFWVDPSACTSELLMKNEVTLKLFNGNLDRWESKWYTLVDNASAHVSQHFIIHFYGTHLRLLLNSYRLQLSILSGGGISKQALWVCYVGVMDMLSLVRDRLGAGSHLFYCQDSIHAMIAYATVLIIKILLYFPRELPPEYESQILNLITETGQAFGRQSSNPSLSVYHQARFLTNIAKQYHISKQHHAGVDKASADEFLKRVSTDFSLEDIDKQTVKFKDNSQNHNPNNNNPAVANATAAAAADGLAAHFDEQRRISASSRGGMDQSIASSLPPNLNGYMSRIPSFSMPPAPGQDVTAYGSNMANVAPTNTSMRFAGDQAYKAMPPHSQEHISQPRGPSLSFPQQNVFPIPNVPSSASQQQGYPAVPDQTAASYPRNVDMAAPSMATMDTTTSPPTGPTNMAFHPPPSSHHQEQHLSSMAAPPPPPPNANANVYMNAPSNMPPNGLICPIFPEHFFWQDVFPDSGDGNAFLPTAGDAGGGGGGGGGSNGHGHSGNEENEHDIATKMRTGMHGGGGGDTTGMSKLKG